VIKHALTLLSCSLIFSYSSEPVQLGKYSGACLYVSKYDNWKGNKYPTGLYDSLLQEFQKLLTEMGLITRKEDGVYKRRKITFHSFRRFVKTTIANQTRNTDYSEWFLGHSKSSYWVKDCMRFLTFLEYKTVQDVVRNTDAELKALRKEMQNSYEEIIKAKDLEIQELKLEKQKHRNLEEELNQIKKHLGLA
jgi:hypothetical protein